MKTMNKVVGPGLPKATYTCCKCGLVIEETHLLFADESYWHEDCLRCICCDVRLAELDKVFYAKANMAFCRQDYLRLYGQVGQCVVCRKRILAFEFVMRVGKCVYHLNCFCCHKCQMRFCVGDKMYIRDSLVLCENHCSLAVVPTNASKRCSDSVQKGMVSTEENISSWNMVHEDPTQLPQDSSSLSAKRLKKQFTSVSCMFQGQTSFNLSTEKREQINCTNPGFEPPVQLGSRHQEDVPRGYAEISSEDNSSGYGSPNSLFNIYADSSVTDLNFDRRARPHDTHER